MEPRFEPVDPLQLDFQADGADTLVAVSGELDLLSLPLFQAELERAATDTPGRLILDADRLEFVDAAGLRAIVDAHRSLGDRLVLRSASPQVRRLLILTGLDDLLEDPSATAKVAYVRRLYDAFQSGGAAALAEIVPDEVQWRPWTSSQPLRGSRELREFWASARAAPIKATDFRQVGGDVIVRIEVPLPDGNLKELWSVCRFEGEFLAQAATFEARDEALAFAA